jgi:hypothetical protein
MRGRRFTPLLTGVAALALLTTSFPVQAALGSSANIAITEIEPAVLSLPDIRRASGTPFPEITILSNPSIPNGCRQSMTSGTKNEYVRCFLNLVARPFTPNFPAYPYSLDVEAYAAPSDAKGHETAIRGYRPRQDGVVGILRDEPTKFAVGYTHSWGTDTVFAMERHGRYLVQSNCTATKGVSSFGTLLSCAEGVNAAQIEQLLRVAPAFGPPAAPIGFDASITGSRATITWLPPLDDGGLPITGYEVSRADGSIACSVTPSPNGFMGCEVPGLKPGAPHEFRVRATNQQGSGPQSTPATVIAARLQPAAPTNVRARALRDAATITWKPVRNPQTLGKVTYEVTASPGGKTCRTTKPTCTIRDLDAGRSYAFRVIARQGGVSSKPVTSKSVRLPLPPPPAAPPPTPAPEPPKPEQEIS